MKKVFRRPAALALVGVATVSFAVFIVASATAARSTRRRACDVCVLLPDTKSSVRWVQFDKPAMTAAFKKAGVKASINNALNDPLKQKAQAQACIAAGAKVVIETALDNGSAASIEKLFTSKGGKAIDYDRQVTGGTASVYVTFDGKAVGKAQAAGVIAAMKANGTYKGGTVAQLWGGQTDQNAYWFQSRQPRRLQPALQDQGDQAGPAAVRARLGCEQRGDHLQPDARQDEQPHPGRAGGERQHRRRGRRRPEGEGPQAAAALRAGRERRRVSRTSSPAGRRARCTSTCPTRRRLPQMLRSRSSRARSRRRTGPGRTASIRSRPMRCRSSGSRRHNYKRLFTDKFLKRSDVCVGAYKQYCK